MTQLAAFLISIAGTLAGRVLISLGIGWVTYEGYSLLADQVIAAVQTNMGGVGASTLAILGLAGFPTAIGVILGAFSAKAALSAVARLGRVA